MPEGDTLHRMARTLGPHAVGQEVHQLLLRRAEFPVGGFVGLRVEKVEAIGKNLLFRFEKDMVLHAHMGMTGEVRAFPNEGKSRGLGPHSAFVLSLERTNIVGYRVPRVRILRGASLAQDPLLSTLGQDLLGGEPLEVATALQAFRTRDADPIGVAIMNQRLVAGVGNVIKSEALFRAKQNPFAPVVSMSDEELARLLHEAQVLLRHNVGDNTYRRVTRFDRTHARNELSVYGRKDEACLDCGERVRMKHQGIPPRSTYYCARCQGVSEAP